MPEAFDGLKAALANLRAKLARKGELPITDAVRILRDVVDALTDAHEHRVVHWHIKPDNVLLTKHHAVVTDFGVAKAVSEATGREKLTTAGLRSCCTNWNPWPRPESR